MVMWHVFLVPVEFKSAMGDLNPKVEVTVFSIVCLFFLFFTIFNVNKG